MSILFNGTSQGLSHVDGLGTNITIGTNDFGTSAWIKANSFQDASVPGILAGDSFGVGSCLPMLIRGSSGLLEIVVHGTFYKPGSVNLLDNAWHHVAIMCDRSGNARFYVDGEPDGVSDISGSAAISIQISSVRIGVLATDPLRWFNGEIVELAFWIGAAPSAFQVKQLYAGGIVHPMPLTVESSSLYTYLPMNDGPAGGTVATVRDFSAGGNNWVDIGSPVFAGDPRSHLGVGPLIVQAPAVVVGGPFPHYIRRRQRGGMIGMGV